MNAVGLDSVKYDLTIVDRTAYQPGSEEAMALEALAAGEGRRLNIETPKGDTLRAVQVAQAVALGRRIASEAGQELNLNAVKTNKSFVGVVSKEDIKFHLFPDRVSTDVLARPEIPADEEPVVEAKRCLSCGRCNLCQSCVLACPDASCELDEEEGKIVFDLYHCKGCGICAYECPRGALIMEGL